MNRKLLSILLAVCMVVSLFTAFAVSADDSANGLEYAKKLNLTEDQLLAISGLMEASAAAEKAYAPDDDVVIMVQLKEKALSDYNRTGTLSDFIVSASGVLAENRIENAQNRMRDRLSALSSTIDVSESEGYSVLVNVISVNAKYSDLELIRAAEGVKNAYVSGYYELPKTETPVTTNSIPSNEMIGSYDAADLGYTGKGILVAVLDSGCDVTHEAFAVDPENPALTEDVVLEIDPDAYVSGKIPFAYDFADEDYDVYPYRSDHGNHVAGTVAGNTGDGKFEGVAPDAQLAIMKVFSDSENGASDSDIYEALEACILLDVDVINMSLGTPCGFTSDSSEIMADMYAALNQSGVFLSISAGNDYWQGLYSNYGTDLYTIASNQDYGVTGSPASYTLGGMSVASIDNNFTYGNWLVSSNRDVIYFSESNDEDMYFFAQLEGEYEIVDCGYGAAEDFNGLDLTGKIALIKRGNISFVDKQSNAENAGAEGVIMYNNVADTILSSFATTGTIPCIGISMEDGEKLVAALADGAVYVTVDPANEGFVPSASAGEPSIFSAWGATPGLTLKPEIAAPGGDIWSTLPDNRYGLMSGTSMAAPHIAGSAAVVLQYVYEKNPDIDKYDAKAVAQALLMNTADPVIYEYSGVSYSYYSPRKQGAGLADLLGAVTTDCYVTVAGSEKPKIELGDTVDFNDELVGAGSDIGSDGTFTFTFTVHNMSDETNTFNLGMNFQIDTVASSINTGTELQYLVDLTPTDLGADFGNIAFSVYGADSETVQITDDGFCYIINDDGDAIITGYAADAVNPTAYIEDGINITVPSEIDGHTVIAIWENAFAYVEYDTITIPETVIYIADYSVGYLFNGDTVLTVLGGDEVTVTVNGMVNTDLLDMFRNYYFENGLYIEGYVTLDNTDAEKEDLSIPYLGYWGDWAAIDMFDKTIYSGDTAFMYASSLIASFFYEGSYYYFDELGYDEYTGEYDADHVAYSKNYIANKYGIDSQAWFNSNIGLLRNADNIRYEITDADGNVVEAHDYVYGSELKSWYYTNGQYINYLYDNEYLIDFDGTELEEGYYTFTVYATAGESDYEQSQSMDFYVDNGSPVIIDVATVSENGNEYFGFYADDEFGVMDYDITLCVELNGEVYYTSYTLQDICEILYLNGIIGEEPDYDAIYASAGMTAVSDADGEYKCEYFNVDVDAFASVLDSISRYAALLFGNGYTFSVDTVALAAMDYAYNTDAVTVDLYDLKPSEEPADPDISDTISGSAAAGRTVYVVSDNETNAFEDAPVGVIESIQVILPEIDLGDYEEDDYIKNEDLVIRGHYNTAAYDYAVEHEFAFEHINDYEDVIVEEATCTEKGIVMHKCSVCEYFFFEEIPETGHFAADEWTVVKDATCCQDGLRVKYCTVCGEIAESETIPSLGHDSESDWVVITEATCTSDGVKAQYCSVCGDLIGIEVVPATGHSDDIDEVVVKAATCTEDGITAKYCSVCGDFLGIEIVTAAGHSPEWVTVSEATYDAPGLMQYICSECGLVLDETEIPQLVGTPELIDDSVFVMKDGYVIGAMEGLSADEVLLQFKHPETLIVTDSEGEKLTAHTNVKTGDVVVAISEGEIIGSVTLVVKGDVNGDGRISGTDYLMVKRYCLGTYDLSEIQYLAADVNMDGEVTAYDYLVIRRHVIGTYNIQ